MGQIISKKIHEKFIWWGWKITAHISFSNWSVPLPPIPHCRLGSGLNSHIFIYIHEECLFGYPDWVKGKVQHIFPLSRSFLNSSAVCWVYTVFEILYSLTCLTHNVMFFCNLIFTALGHNYFRQFHTVNFRSPISLLKNFPMYTFVS
jgi:hypothetical protein